MEMRHGVRLFQKAKGTANKHEDGAQPVGPSDSQRDFTAVRTLAKQRHERKTSVTSTAGAYAFKKFSVKWLKPGFLSPV